MAHLSRRRFWLRGIPYMTSAQTKWFKFAEKQLLNFADRGGRGSENFKRLWIMKAPTATVCLKSFGFVSSFGFLLGHTLLKVTPPIPPPLTITQSGPSPSLNVNDPPGNKRATNSSSFSVHSLFALSKCEMAGNDTGFKELGGF